MAGKSPRSKAYEEERFSPMDNLNTMRHLKKIKNKDVYSKYIHVSVLRQEDRY